MNSRPTARKVQPETLDVDVFCADGESAAALLRELAAQCLSGALGPGEVVHIRASGTDAPRAHELVRTIAPTAKVEPRPRSEYPHFAASIRDVDSVPILRAIVTKARQFLRLLKLRPAEMAALETLASEREKKLGRGKKVAK
jgi:hypothetical protein